MILIIGLGNPGKQYKSTRHNIGFRVIDELAREYNFPDFRLQKKSNALISEGAIGGEKTILAKPQTFMNNSGKAAKALINYYKIQTENLWVINDDIDLPLGKIKISGNQGAAGHKGVTSIIEELKTKDFWRIRIGIRPEKGKPKNVEKFVLQKFTKEEERILKEVIKEIIQEIETRLVEIRDQ